jgi:large subunit ribosomal protein L23
MSSASRFADARHYDVIVSPVITEKATFLSENDQVVFKVKKSANKAEIKAAVERLFDVKVEAVNTLVTKGKSRVFKGVRKPGRMGTDTVTQKGLRVVKVDAERNLILVSGSVAGPNGALVTVDKVIR